MRPKGSVRIAGDQMEAEYVCVPSSVARLLARKKKAGEIGDPLEYDQFMDALDAVTRLAAKQRVGQLLARRDYATREVVQKLAQDGFSSSAAADAVAYFEDAGLLSDRRFAESYVRSKVAAGWGMGRIEHELSKRGLEVRDLEGWPYGFLNPEEERSRALAVARRKTVREPNAYAKLVRFLAGRGYSYAVSTSVAQEVLG